MTPAAPGKKARYPGSPPFGDSELDRRLFWGRPDEAEAVLHSILSHDLFVLYAISGTGKTSLLRAGVMHRLRDRELWPIVVRLNDCERPVTEVIRDELKRTDDEFAWLEVLGIDVEAIDLWDLLSRLEIWRGNVLLLPVLIFDQFEELFTLWRPSARRAFIEELGNVVRGTPPSRIDAGEAGSTPRAKIVLSLREDFLGHVEELSTDMPQVLGNRYRLRKLTGAQAAEAIVKPAQVVHPDLVSEPFDYHEDAVELIVNFLGREQLRGDVAEQDDIETKDLRVEAFQLQLVCQHVEDVVVPGKVPASGSDRVEVTADDLGGQDGLTDVLTRFYANQLHAFDRRRQRRVRKLCEERLISASERRLSLAEEELTDSVSADQLEQLVRQRVLRREPRLNTFYYELAHDSLVQPILAHRSEQREIRMRQGAGLLATVLALVVVGLWWLGPLNFTEREAAEEFVVRFGGDQIAISDDRQLVATAVDGRVELWNSRGDLIGAPDHPGTAVAVDLSDAGDRMVAAFVSDAGAAGQAVIWRIDGDAIERLRVLPHDGPVLSARFAPTDESGDGPGRRLLTTSADRTARLWASDGEQLIRSLPHDGSVFVGAYSDDGSRILTASDDGIVRTWSPDGVLLAELDHASPVLAATFGDRPDVVVTGTEDGVTRVWIGGREQAVHRPDVGTRGAATDADLAINAVAVTSTATIPGMGIEPGDLVVAAASEDGTARLWNTGTDATVEVLHGGPVNTLELDGNGLLVTGSDDGTALVRVPNGQLQPLDHRASITTVRILPQGLPGNPDARVLTAGQGDQTNVWTLEGQRFGLFSSTTDFLVVSATTEEPVVGANFTIDLGAETVQGVTDRFGVGAVDLGDQSSDSVTVTITASGYEERRSDLDVGSSSDRIRLVGLPGTISGEARTEAGGAVNVWLRTGDEVTPTRTVDGRFEFSGVPTPDGYTIEFFEDGHEVRRVQVSLESSDDPDERMVELEPVTLAPSQPGTMLANGVALREGPSLQTPRIWRFSQARGRPLRIVGDAVDGWYDVEFEGRRGWIYAGFILPAEPGTAVARTRTHEQPVLRNEHGEPIDKRNPATSWLIVVGVGGELWEVLLADNTTAWVRADDVTLCIRDAEACL